MTTKISEHLLQRPVIGKNYIMNPTFDINQRGFTGGAGFGYTFDRWKNNNVNMSISTVASDGFITISGGIQTYDNFQQAIETISGVLGEVVTVSWEGTSQMQYHTANGNAWTAKASSPVTFTMSSTGSTAVTGAMELIGFGNGTLKNVKVELGTNVSSFEYPDLASETSKCMRYYQTDYLAAYACIGIARGGVSNISQVQHTSFVQRMRATPTMSGAAAGAVAVAIDGISATQNPVTATAEFRTHSSWRWITSGGTIVNGGAYALFNGATGAVWEADAEL